ncbi:MAG: hypothetical protein Q7S39_01640, partial [Ignavibacteria bacterium]|nr:hypothetical protein [Ignavibacteria bacterium]
MPIVIDFMNGNNYTSALIYGRNGTGKSSIVDAWEWLNRFQILHLSREGVLFTDFPHKASGGNNSYISVDFHHSTISTVKATFNSRKITTPTITGEYDQFIALSTYPNYLRYSDLQDFVYKTKAERYKYIAKFFGLEKFSLLQDTLQAAINKQISNLQNHQTQLNASTAAINAITGFKTVDENTVVKFINSIGGKHKLPAITQFKEADSIRTASENIVSANPVTKELTEWQAFQRKQDQFYTIAPVKANCTALEKVFTDLKKNEESIKQLILSNLYELSIEVFPTLEDKTKCPVCDNEFEGDLLKHIKEKHSTLDALNKKKLEFDTKKAALEKQFENLTRKIAAIQSESSAIILTALKAFFDDLNTINATLPTITATLKKQLKDLCKIEISSDPAIAKIESIITSEAANKKIVTDKITALSKDEETKTLAQDFTNISNIISGFKSFLVNTEKVKFLTTISANLNNFFSKLTSFIQTKIQTTFTTISADVVDCFNALESSNQFIKNPELKLITDKDKAVELEIEFV